ncbi:hypothetical protein SISNIDRAFT_408739, partial [Sistotremastrum niveocremeum HHB9708]
MFDLPKPSPISHRDAPTAFASLAVLSERELEKYFPLSSHTDVENPIIKQLSRGVFVSKFYKPVAMKKNPVPGVFPDEFKIVRKFPEDPLLSLPSVPTSDIPPFEPGVRLTLDRWEVIRKDLEKVGFLLPEEIRLVGHILKSNEMGIAWNDEEKGQFREDYFEPVRFPTVPHVPWVEKNMRIPPGLYDKLVAELQRKIDMGVLEPSNSSYRSRWFVVPKKDG